MQLSGFHSSISNSPFLRHGLMPFLHPCIHSLLTRECSQYKYQMRAPRFSFYVPRLSTRILYSFSHTRKSTLRTSRSRISSEPPPSPSAPSYLCHYFTTSWAVLPRTGWHRIRSRWQELLKLFGPARMGRFLHPSMWCSKELSARFGTVFKRIPVML